MPVAGNKSSKWEACRLKATRLEYCLKDNNHRPIDCVPEILDLKQCCQLYEWKTVHCGYVPEEEPAPPPSRKLVIEPQIDPMQAEKMFIDYVAQLAERYRATARAGKGSDAAVWAEELKSSSSSPADGPSETERSLIQLSGYRASARAGKVHDAAAHTAKEKSSTSSPADVPFEAHKEAHVP